MTRFCDCVSQTAVDENSISAISVTMKAGMRMREMSMPLMKPISVPAASMTITATATAEPLPARTPPPSSIRYPHSGLPPSSAGSTAVVMTTAPSTLTNPMMAPCDRSMPPMMMTKVWPIATASSGQTLESWLLRLRGLARSGKKIAITTK